jgi:hypothetical protein
MQCIQKLKKNANIPQATPASSTALLRQHACDSIVGQDSLNGTFAQAFHLAFTFRFDAFFNIKRQPCAPSQTRGKDHRRDLTFARQAVVGFEGLQAASQ